MNTLIPIEKMEEMIGEAQAKYSDICLKYNKGITMPHKCRTFNDCFTIAYRKILFWFDTPDRSTHIIERKL